MAVGEKAPLGVQIVCEGRQGHGSVPLNADNALARASNIVLKLHNHKSRVQILNSSQNPDVRKIAPLAHSLTSMTLSPNHLTGTEKCNVVPGNVKLEVDIRGLPGQSYADVWRELERALGPMHILTEEEMREQYQGERPPFLNKKKTVRVLNSDRNVKLFCGDFGEDEEDPYNAGSSSSFDTELWRAMEDAAKELVQDAQLVPLVLPGTTDNRFYRLHPLSSAVSYGASLFHSCEPFGVIMERFHGVNERINVKSIDLTTQFYQLSLFKFFS